MRAFELGTRHPNFIPRAEEWKSLLRLAIRGRLGVGIFPKPIFPGYLVGKLPPGVKIPVFRRIVRRKRSFEGFPVEIFRIERGESYFVRVFLKKKPGYRFKIVNLTSFRTLDWGYHENVSVRIPYSKSRIRLTVWDIRSPRKWTLTIFVGRFQNRLLIPQYLPPSPLDLNDDQLVGISPGLASLVGPQKIPTGATLHSNLASIPSPIGISSEVSIGLPESEISISPIKLTQPTNLNPVKENPKNKDQ